MTEEIECFQKENYEKVHTMMEIVDFNKKDLDQPDIDLLISFQMHRVFCDFCKMKYNEYIERKLKDIEL